MPQVMEANIIGGCSRFAMDFCIGRKPFLEVNLDCRYGSINWWFRKINPKCQTMGFWGSVLLQLKKGYT